MIRIVYFLMAFLTSAALIAAPEKGESKKEKTERFKANVAKIEPLDDVLIKSIKAHQREGNTQFVSPEILMFVGYVDPEFDFQALSDSIEKSVGKTGGYLIKDYITGLSKYLGRNNMSMQSVNINGNNAISKLDSGLPIFCWLSFVDKKIIDRTKERESETDIKEWTKKLRKSELKNLKPAGSTYIQALIIGYNKATGEYLIVGATKEPVWMTQKELSGVLLDAFVLRF